MTSSQVSEPQTIIRITGDFTHVEEVQLIMLAAHQKRWMVATNFHSFSVSSGVVK